MTSTRKISFLSRMVISMFLSILINFFLGFKLSEDLSGNQYSFVVEMNYPLNGITEVHLDTGKNFNNTQKITRKINKGINLVNFKFNLASDEHLKFLRLDFGSNDSIKSVEVISAKLSTKNKILFEFDSTQIKENIIFSNHILNIDDSKPFFIFDLTDTHFDPYFVFDHVNELIYPLWLRTILLVLPWIILFFFQLINWANKVVQENKLILIFVSIFIVSIPLKDAWVTFSTLLLLSFSLYNFYKQKIFKVNTIGISVLFLFLIPLLLIGNGHFSKLVIPLGFLFFGLIGLTIDFSTHLNTIKKIYTTICYLICSIFIVSWLILMFYNGYYYNIDITNYFSDIKENAYAINFWLFNSHTTFISFFILVGSVFSFDLYRKKLITKSYNFLYLIFSLCAILILGSRIAIVLYLIIPILFLFSTRYIALLILPIIMISFLIVISFISSLDAIRTQLWAISWSAIENNFWTGLGTGTSENVFLNKELNIKSGYNYPLKINHSHNQYLTYLLENGLLGLLMFIIVFTTIIFQYYKLNKKYMLIIIIMILLLMLFESPFKTSVPLYFISFLLIVFADKEKPCKSYQ